MYTTLSPGTSPIVLSVPHDGGIQPDGVPRRPRSCARDEGTLTLALSTRDHLRRDGVDPTLVVFTLHRSFADPNRHPQRAPYAPGFRDAYAQYHAAIQLAVSQHTDAQGECLLLDIHGYRMEHGPDVVVGTDSHRTSPHGSDTALAGRLGATLEPLPDREPHVVFAPSAQWPLGKRFRGGWIVRRAAQRFADTRVDAIQLEFNHHRLFDGQIPDTARALAAAIARHKGSVLMTS